MRNLVEATWFYKTQHVAETQQVPVNPINRRLAAEILSVSGRYLDCFVPRSGAEIHFFFAVRHEENGFVKLDLQFDQWSEIGIIGGFDLSQYPTERFLSLADKYYQVASRAEPNGFVPAIVFGICDEVGFYIESLYDFERVTPFFIHASHAFIAVLLSVHFSHSRTQLLRYIDRISSGKDQLRLLEREPLMRAIITGLPEESIAPFYRQLGAELSRIVEQRG